MEQEAILKYLLVLEFVAEDNPSPKEVKDRWKLLCRKHHPDLGGDKDDFLRIMHAYNMLTDPEYRHKNMLDEMRRKNAGSGFGDISIRISVPISFEDGFFGRPVVFSFNRLTFDENYKIVIQKELDVIVDEIQIPPGTCGVAQIMRPQLGHIHKPSLERGDLFVQIITQPHAKFRLQNMDIVSVEQIPLETLLKGGKVEVATLYGMRPLRIPPGTKPGAMLKIRGCGVQGRSDHLVQVDALFPSQEDLKGEEWSKLGINWAVKEEEDKEAADLEALFRKMTSNSGTFTIQFVGG